MKRIGILIEHMPLWSVTIGLIAAAIWIILIANTVRNIAIGKETEASSIGLALIFSTATIAGLAMFGANGIAAAALAVTTTRILLLTFSK